MTPAAATAANPTAGGAAAAAQVLKAASAVALPVALQQLSTAMCLKAHLLLQQLLLFAQSPAVWYLRHWHARRRQQLHQQPTTWQLPVRHAHPCAALPSLSSSCRCCFRHSYQRRCSSLPASQQVHSARPCLISEPQSRCQVTAQLAGLTAQAAAVPAAALSSTLCSSSC